ncbi:ARMT1-like domain-containing protein [Ignisphaera sp. 4213-co]|uniref:ARMT1-like domain-containing protein n=1 Tax=Ignisphaera cupida TaxID=3050454 RepID=A0ABD4Z9Z9_9CREN|nr:ARMT1-like domain-containing protein [Ignisphaera sp. 4213-co]MDK6029125.1 ARMT1-like domain-containing protein [Ignisphaera sp. 4213-co]
MSMWIDNDYCKLCLIYSRSKDLIDLGCGNKLPALLKKLAKIVDEENSRSKAFTSSFEYIKRVVKNKDPYQEKKNVLKEIGKRIAQNIEKHIASVNWDIREALRISAAANIIDTNVLGYENVHSLDEAIWDKPVIEDIPDIPKNEDIYLVLDNAGEAEVDKVLAKTLIHNGYKVFIVVRSKPYEIDVTIKDFEESNFNIISTPGSISPIAYIDKGFVIAKGIANAEAYAEFGKTKSLHLLRAKCDVIAKKFGVPKNSVLILSGDRIKKTFDKNS